MSLVLVTGAGGFVGSAAVDAALAAGCTVRGQVRRGAGRFTGPNVEEVIADLRVDELSQMLAGVDAVIHCAAAKSGDFHTQYASTVRGTERLLHAAVAARVRRVVLCSSVSVYDYRRLRRGALVDEEAPLCQGDAHRDAYAQTKLLQEEVATTALETGSVELVVLRLGVVYDASSWWTYRLGERFGRVWLALGGASTVPLVHVEDGGRALVHGTSPAVAPGTYNVLAPDPPTQREFRRVVARRARPRPLVIPVPWTVASLGVGALEHALRRSGAVWKLPGFLTPSSLAVRAKPLRFDGHRFRATGWVPQHAWRKDLRETSR